MANGEGEVVCVTGGSGFIGSWLVSSLLDRGYTVHATVKDLSELPFHFDQFLVRIKFFFSS